MASKILGRTECPFKCGNSAAYVKLKTDKTTTAYPYVHCRGCGAQAHAKNDEQAAHLLKITRPEKLDMPPATPTPTPSQAPTPEPSPEPPPKPAPAPRRLFGRAP